MKVSLSVKLVFLIAAAILISSLVTTILVSSQTSLRFKGYALERDRNMALTIAGALTNAAEQGVLNETIQSIYLSQNPSPPRNGMMGGGRPGRMMGMGAGWGMMSPGNGNRMILAITDAEGKVLRDHSLPEEFEGMFLPDALLAEGVPYYSKNSSIAGYVLAGSMLLEKLPESEVGYLHSLLAGILLSSLLAAILASGIGFIALSRILRPLQSLNKGVRLLGEGDYTYRVENPGTGDELSQLAEGFNEMSSSIHASEEWKKQIISDTAHELRTPVSLIMGNLEMMMEGVYQADEKRLQSLYEESSLLAELIKDLQLLATTESSMTTLEKESFSPDELVRLTADGFRAVTRNKTLNLDVDVSFGKSWEGDRRKIQQVLKNLLSNAVRHSPEHGRIILRTRLQEGQLMLDVEDSGPGIPEEERQRVFDRFYRLDKARNRGDGGSGLGLAISKAIIDLHGGTINVLTGKNGGALFRIFLPIS